MEDLDVRNLGWRALHILAAIALGVGGAIGLLIALPGDNTWHRGATVNPFAVFAVFIGIASACHVAIGALAARLGRARRIRTLIPWARALTPRRTHRA